jgi:RNA polymerase sigma-54 factor
MFEMSMAPEMGMRVTPALLNLAHLLTMPSLELQQAVQQELSENPALEEVEAQEHSCARCGGPVVDGLCLRCARDSAGEEPQLGLADDANDPLLFVAAPRSMTESLLSDLYASLPIEDHPIAMGLVGSLDDSGFLRDEPADLADVLQVEEERVLAVLRRLRELGPPGIATRDARECMLAQIDALESQGVSCPYARVIVADHMEDLGARRTRQIARALKASLEDVEAARLFIRKHLWPYPLQAATDAPASPQRTRYRTPDIAIHRRDDKFVVEVLHSPRRIVRLNPIYQDLARHAANLDEGERAHVQEYVARARVFMANLRQREVTMQRIGESIVTHQEGYLLHGVRHLVPLTRSEIAAELGVHESTVSRATSDKTALLPNHTLLPMSEFFVVARGVQDVLRELITSEKTPLSDEELARLLGERGYPIARRTVAKYRDLMKIPPSHLR